MTFDKIYETIKGNFEPQPRSIRDLGAILSEVEILSKHPRFHIQMDASNEIIQEIELNTTVARLLDEIKTTESEVERDGRYLLSSEGIERAIAKIKTIKIKSYTPEPENSTIYYLQISGTLIGLKKYFINSIREVLVLTRKTRIQDNIQKFTSKVQKLNYLNNSLISMQQSESSWDNYQFGEITRFLKLELKKWNLMVDEITSDIHFHSNESLYSFIIKLIENRLNHNVKYEEGYRIFWRDEKCLEFPKHEPEIQSYIKSILKPYCDEKNIKISREESIANGRIDLSFSYLSYTICLEIKKAEHQDILTSITTQLTEYMIGGNSNHGIYLILWYKSEDNFNKPKQFDTLDQLVESIIIPSNSKRYKVLGIDCSKPISPSKRK